jgi:hypothetical protein
LKNKFFDSYRHGMSSEEKFNLYWIPEPILGCWLWHGATTSAGYGHIQIDRKDIPAHRLSWELANGSIPEDMNVCHRCDNTHCVNPAHLFLGTFKENSRDMVNKGRCFKSKLSRLQAREIAAATGSHASIAKKYGVTPENISQIRRGLTWK